MFICSSTDTVELLPDNSEWSQISQSRLFKYHGKLKPSFFKSFNKGQKVIWSKFTEVAERHLESGSPPGGLEELHQGAELWAFNTDFSLEFPQPLLPYTVLVGGVLNHPANPPEQVSCLDPLLLRSSVKRHITFTLTFFGILSTSVLVRYLDFQRTLVAFALGETQGVKSKE